MKLCKCGCGKEIQDHCTYVKGHHNRDPLIKEKKEQTYLNKYGVKNPSLSKDVQNKKIETIRKHYGSDYYFVSEEGKQKIKNTNLEKYGVDNPFKLKHVQEKIKEIKKDTYLQTGIKIQQQLWNEFYDTKIVTGIRLENKFIPLFKKEEYKGVDNVYKFKCNKCGNIFESTLDDGIMPRCLICKPYITTGGQSKIEDELVLFIRSLGEDCKVQNRKIIYPLELDVYIPNKNIAFELDGLYWHSELQGKTRNYHLIKTNKCEENNIKLIHIFEDEWKYKQDIVKNRIRHILNKVKYSIYARKCLIKEVDFKIKNTFLNKYHIQGNDVSYINLGAYYRNRLVAVMTFSKLRKALGQEHKPNQWELSRFCTIAKFNIIGIASKLLNHFEQNYKTLSIISYADRRWSQGNLYYKLGFNLDHISQPNYWYIRNQDIQMKRHHRFNFRKDVLCDKLEKYDFNLSEWENMKNNNWNRIWDCGSLVFKKIYSNTIPASPLSP